MPVRNIHGGVIGIVRDPLIKGWSDLERFDPPASTLAVDRGAVNAFCTSTNQFVLAGTLVRPFERLCFLRTMEQALVDVLTRPPEFLELFERLHYHYLAEVEAWAATDVDAIVLMDDWGAQDRMMVSPAIWRELYRPIYRRYCDVDRSAGKFVFMHSDGWILDILPDLIDVGVNALNSQIACMGPAAMGQYRGQMTFWGEIDRQVVLSFGTLRTSDAPWATCGSTSTRTAASSHNANSDRAPSRTTSSKCSAPGARSTERGETCAASASSSSRVFW